MSVKTRGNKDTAQRDSLTSQEAGGGAVLPSLSLTSIGGASGVCKARTRHRKRADKRLNLGERGHVEAREAATRVRSQPGAGPGFLGTAGTCSGAAFADLVGVPGKASWRNCH